MNEIPFTNENEKEKGKEILSDKRVIMGRWAGEDIVKYPEEDVKECFENIIEDIIQHRNISQYKHPESEIIVALSDEIIEIINKRAGDKLLEKKG